MSLEDQADLPASLSDYMRRVERQLKPLPRHERPACLAELQGHLLEAVADGVTLEGAMVRMGAPEEFVPALVHERLQALAAQAHKPHHMINLVLFRLALGGWQAIKALVISLLYTSAAFAFFTGLYKLIAPDRVGFFRRSDGSFLLGTISEGHAYEPLLGWAYTPLALALAVSIFLIIPRLFQLRRLNFLIDQSYIALHPGKKRVEINRFYFCKACDRKCF